VVRIRGASSSSSTATILLVDIAVVVVAATAYAGLLYRVCHLPFFSLYVCVSLSMLFQTNDETSIEIRCMLFLGVREPTTGVYPSWLDDCLWLYVGLGWVVLCCID